MVLSLHEEQVLVFVGETESLGLLRLRLCFVVVGMSAEMTGVETTVV